MRWRPTVFAVVLIIGLTVNCGSSNPTISDSNFDKSCSSDSECTPVWIGDVCSCDDVGAISRGALEEFQNRKTSLQEECTTLPSCVAPNTRWNAACNGGTCIVTGRRDAGGTDASTSDTGAEEATDGAVD